MFIKQSDLFWEMDKAVVKDIMGIAVRESYQQGDFLFHEGDLADYFYILIKGRVKLSIGDTGPAVYTVDNAGEAFGWSSLIGREAYSASGQCLKPTVLDNFHRAEFAKVLEKHPKEGLQFFKRLAGLIGNRLLWSYQMITSAAKAEDAPSFGTGQIQESEAAA